MQRDESPEQSHGLRTGLTTGSCATACCVGAAHLLLANNRFDHVTITLPTKAHRQHQTMGKQVTLTISDYHIQQHEVMAATIKDAGDDPDVTHGATVFVILRLQTPAQIDFAAAEGVGTVTRSGLSLAMGEPAINPVPRQMMSTHLQQLAQHYAYTGGFNVAVGVKNGAALAKKTLNARLGIIGGLSILGTTGIVRPFSCSAYIASIHQAINVARANHCTHLAASTGNRSEAFIAQHYQLADVALIEMGDFVGAVLKYLKRNPVEKLSICGGFGKISKLANGHLDLHSRNSQIDFVQLANYAKILGADKTLQANIHEANTSLEALKLCQQEKISLADYVCEQALRKVEQVLPNVNSEVWVVDRAGNYIAYATSI
jgi:cobalt-precorrin-5B (C1)-methyltransferase